ncbi:hypothetical protein ABEH28_13490 [Pseudomonas sp. Ps21-P2]|uniref:hypothetical protein n=1 Tax=Pseudomonas sp. Ps21-P2 TaxID=3080331 RepID=UPI003209D481
MLSQNDFPAVRDGSLTIHCISVVIEQKKEGGIRLAGHGIIKINSVGTLYLEFVCLEACNVPVSLWGNHFPVDPFAADQKLFLSAITITNDKLSASDFSLRIRQLDRPPFITYAFVSSIKFTEEVKQNNEFPDFIYFEIKEKVAIPKNKINTEKSSLGSESYKTNQTVLAWDGIDLSVVNYDDYVSITAKGKFDTEHLLESLLFYIGFTAGSMPQPYIFSKRSGSTKELSVGSVLNSARTKSIPAVVCDRAIIDGVWQDESHFQLLRLIVKLKLEKPKYFESIYAQWKRVWFGYHASREIRNLTLGVAVEGVLNDIYIPKFQEVVDGEFEAKKKEIIEKVEKLEIDQSHIKVISKSVGGWGNIHAGAALKILEKKGIVSKDEIKAHSKIRNSSAHPKSVEETIPRLIREHKHVGMCFNLLYGLMLNVLNYEGSQFSYGEGFEAELVWRSAVDVLGIASEDGEQST